MLLRRAEGNRWADDPFVAEMLRRGLKRQLGFTENLPSGESVNDAVVRTAPMVSAPSDSPLSRPRRVLSTIPVETPVVNETPIPQRPLETPVFTPPTTTEGLETRLRRVLPEDPLTVARENADAARRLTLTEGGYGFDSEGNPRTGPKKGFLGRLGAGLKMLGRGAQVGAATAGPGGAIGGGLASLLAGIVDPSLPAKMRKDEAVRRTEGTLERVLGEQKAITDLESDQTMNAMRQAQIPYLLQRPELAADKQALEEEKFAQKQAYDAWRMSSGDRKQDTYENWLEWRMKNGDMRQATYADYVDFQKSMGERRQTETERHNRESETIGRANVGVRSESNQIRREQGGAGGYTARDRANAQRLINQARMYRTRAASARTQEAADELNATAVQFEEDARTQYPDLVEEDSNGFLWGKIGGRGQVRMKGNAPAPSRSVRPKLTEQQIRDAAKSRGLNPDEAVKRARARGQL